MERKSSTQMRDGVRWLFTTRERGNCRSSRNFLNLQIVLDSLVARCRQWRNGGQQTRSVRASRAKRRRIRCPSSKGNHRGQGGRAAFRRWTCPLATAGKPALASLAIRASRRTPREHEPQANQTRSTAYGQVSGRGLPPASPTACPTRSSSRRAPRRAERLPSSAAGAARRPSADW